MGIKRYAINTSWLMAEKILRLAVGFSVSILVMRHLGPLQFGSLAYSQNYAVLFSAVATLGLEGVVARDLVKNPENRNVILGTAFYLRIMGGGVMIAAILASFLLLSERHGIKLMIVFVACGQLILSFNVIDAYFQSKVMARYIAIANSIAFGLSSIGKLILIFLDAPVHAFAAMVVLDALTVTFGFLYFYFKQGETLKGWRFRPSYVKDLLHDSWPLMISFFFTTVSLRIDQVLIKKFVGVEAVGYYAASLRFVEVFYFIPVALTTSMYPKLVQLSHSGDYKNKVQALNSLLTLVAVMIAAVLIAAKEFVIPILFGSAYSVTAEILLFHAVSLVFIFNFSLRKKLLLIESRSTYVLYYSIATACLMVLFLYTFLPRYGVVGAAIAHLMAWSVSLTVLPLVMGRPSEVLFFIKSFNPAYIASVLRQHRS